MGLLDDVTDKVDNYLAGTYETYKPRDVPNPEDIPLGTKAAELETTSVFIDVRQSSDITNAFRQQTAAKMMKAFFDGSVRIVNANDGFVRSFNGDGLLAMFVGKLQSNNSVKAAMQIKWFVRKLLGPRFDRYFKNNMTAVGSALDFDVGVGIDYGEVFAVRVGIKGTNDVAWVGRCTNTAAKLSNVTKSPRSIGITRAVYERLKDSRKYSKGDHMWTTEEFLVFGGVRRAIRRTSYWWNID